MHGLGSTDSLKVRHASRVEVVKQAVCFFYWLTLSLVVGKGHAFSYLVSPLSPLSVIGLPLMDLSPILL